MSRIIVKNLPKRMSEEELKKLFETKGVITDMQLKYTKNGQFRQFAFIGYQNEAEAQEAMSYYHNTFLNTSRIKVEICSSLGDPNKPRAWSKYAQDSSNSIKKKAQHDDEIQKSKEDSSKMKKSIVKTDDVVSAKIKDDPEFEEFMQLHKISGKMLWGNDTADFVDTKTKPDDESEASNEENEGEDGEENAGEEDGPKGRKSMTDLEYLKSKVVKNKNTITKTEEDTQQNDAKKYLKMTEFTVKILGLPLKCKKSLIKEFFKPLQTRDIRQPRKISGVTYVQFANETEVKQALVKHRSFLEGKRLHITMCKVKCDDKSDETNKWSKLTEDLTKNTETIIESGSLFVRNLSYTVTEDDLQKLFSEYGPIAEVRLPIDRFTRRIKAFAFVDFVMPEHAFQAYTNLDGTVFQGRVLHILPGKCKAEEKVEEGEDASYKKTKADKQKKESGSSFNWNSLFLDANAVADLTAQKYNTTKQDLLSQETSESIAVRLALGETQIVIDTKNFLKSNGVNLDSFETGGKHERSKTIILVKNLPANTMANELRELFGKYGEVGRVVLPPSGITAIVEFHDPYEARKAFKNLAYTKFYNAPLYLEWAPGAVFTKEKLKADEIQSSTGGIIEETTDTSKNNEKEEEKDGKHAEDGTTLYVKNLNFETTDDSLKSHFEKYGELLSATVAKKPDLRNPGSFLSMGYGFVQYILRSDAQKAIKYAQNSLLDEHQLELKLSDRTTRKDLKAMKSKSAKLTPQKSTKMLVRNIPFEATRKEVTNLFRTFGEVKAVRLPKKMTGTGSHRGFAFVEFSTRPDAKRAFEALRHSTHLYGRRLVLEWADTESDTVEALRTKTAEHYHEDAPAPKKIRKAAIMEQLMTVSDSQHT